MISSVRPVRGYTIVELLVACVLSIMVLGMMFAFLIPTMHASARGSARVEMQQQAVVALGHLTDDLERSAAAGVSLNSAGFTAQLPTNPPVSPTPTQIMPTVLGIHRLVDVDSQGNQEWDTTEEIYYWCPQPANPVPVGPGQQIKSPGNVDQVGNLVLYTCQNGESGVLFNVPPGGSPPTHPTAPTRLTDPVLIGVDTNPPAAKPQILATGVKYFVVAMGGAGPGGYISQPITVLLQLERQTATGSQTPESFTFQRTVSLRNSN